MKEKIAGKSVNLDLMDTDNYSVENNLNSEESLQNLKP